MTRNVERGVSAAGAWRQALCQEVAAALAAAEEVADAIAAISGAGGASAILAECAHDALKQVSELHSVSRGIGLLLPLRQPVVNATFFWQTQAIVEEVRNGAEVEASLFPFLQLHVRRLSLQWQLMAELALKCGNSGIVDLLTKGAEARLRVRKSVEAVAHLHMRAGESAASSIRHSAPRDLHPARRDTVR